MLLAVIGCKSNSRKQYVAVAAQLETANPNVQVYCPHPCHTYRQTLFPQRTELRMSFEFASNTKTLPCVRL
jgi:hypothetical protein